VIAVAPARLPAPGRAVEPLETLFELRLGSGQRLRAGLPEELRRSYDGDLAIPLRDGRPTVIGNMVSTLDGAVALDREGHSGGGAISGFSRTDRLVMGLLRAMADVVLVGAGTVRASSGTGWIAGAAYPEAADAYRELRQRLGMAREPVTLIVTGRGHLDPGHPAFQDAARDVVIAAPPATARDLRRAGFRTGIRIESMPAGDGVSPAALVHLAGDLGARVLLTEGGPHLLAELAAAGLLDELFLTLAPQLVGRDTGSQRLSLLEGVALGPDDARWGRVVSIRRGGDHLFLRYSFEPGTSSNTTQQ
jgi:riboflavin biosynthesis pyrimidine reductase